MQALNEHLVRREHALIQLLDPPFNTSSSRPWLYQGICAGCQGERRPIHPCAIWAAMAFARLGDSTRAWELMTMINPVNHGKSPEDIATYKVEPYVVAADVYAVAPHIGRGGWTWYTGSAGWMYRLITESLLGIKREGESLRFEPCLPEDWADFKMRYRYRDTFYHIIISQTTGDWSGTSVTLDNIEQHEGIIPLLDDRMEHRVEVKIVRE